MRDLRECQAEVFRRSEKRIKRRRRILMASVPLVLCGVLLSFARPDGTEGIVIEGAPEHRAEITVAGIEVSGEGAAWSISDDTGLMAVSARLDSYLPDAIPEEHRELGSEESAEDQDVPDGGYTITVIMNDGTVTEYHLTGTRLENRTGGGGSNLTQSAARELKELLGIPVP